MTEPEDGRTFDYIFGKRDDGDAYSDEALGKLAGLMTSPPPEPRPKGEADAEDGPIPAGYTYLGQFIDHDLVFDETSKLDGPNVLSELRNTAAPRFDLDSLYGRGPAADPPFEGPDRLLFQLGDTVSTDPRLEGPDLPRDGRKARIGDPRNDENVIISQLHSLFLRFHNRMARHVALAQPALTGTALFEEARRQVCRHYQWIVVNDFLPKIVGQAAVDRALQSQLGGPPAWSGQRRFDPRARLYMPLEFSGAAYRFGHSMVRPAYRLNDAIRKPLLTGEFGANTIKNLIGFRPLPSVPQGWGIQWKYFFEPGVTPSGKPMQRARRIDAQLANPLAALAGIVKDHLPLSLAERNLRRGRAFGLLSGQQVANAMGISPIEDKELLVGPGNGARLPINEVDDEFANNAPLWYYILREADLEQEGRQLGQVGGRLVAEVFIGLLAADPSSYLNADPSWAPDPAFAVGLRFGMPELIRAVVQFG